MKFNKIINRLYVNFDVFVSVLLIVFGITFIVLGFKFKVDRLEQISIFLILAATIFLVLRNRFPKNYDFIYGKEFSRKTFVITSIIFYISLIIGMLIINQDLYSRPLSFLLVISLLAGLVAVQIISTDDKVHYYLILFEIIVLGIVIRATVYYQFYGLIGGDPWVHAGSINSIISLGHVTDKVAGYYYFPFMHILGAFIHDLTGLNLKNSMFVIGLCEFLSLIFIFLIVKKIFDYKMGLLAFLILSVATYTVEYGFLVIPQTLGISFLVILIYLFFIQKNLDTVYKKMIFSVFIMLFLTSSVLTHTITSFATLIVLSAIFIVDFVRIKISDILKIKLKNRNYVTGTLLALFFIFIIYYWMFSSGFIGVIGETIKWGFSSVYQAPSVSTVTESFSTTFFKMLPLYTFSFLAIIGFLYTLRIKSLKTINIYGWVILGFVFLAVFLNLNSFLPARWFIFIQICLIVPVVISILILSQVTAKRAITIFLLISLFSITALTSYEANAYDVNPYTPYPASGVKYSEYNVGFIDMIPNDVNVYTDLGNRLNTTLPVEDASSILAGEDKLDGILLFRTSLENNSYLTSSLGGGHYSIEKLRPSFLTEMQKYDRIYDSGTVIAFKGG